MQEVDDEVDHTWTAACEWIARGGGPLVVDADWHAFGLAIYKGIDGEKLGSVT